MLPMLGLSITYCHLGTALWRDQEPQQSMGNRRKVNDKRKLAKMFIVILIVFGVCWLPYHSYFIYTYHNTVRIILVMTIFLSIFSPQSVMGYKYTQHVFLAFFWLAMTNSALNPLIYFSMNAK